MIGDFYQGRIVDFYDRRNAICIVSLFSDIGQVVTPYEWSLEDRISQLERELTRLQARVAELEAENQRRWKYTWVGW